MGHPWCNCAAKLCSARAHSIRQGGRWHSAARDPCLSVDCECEHRSQPDGGRARILRGLSVCAREDRSVRALYHRSLRPKSHGRRTIPMTTEDADPFDTADSSAAILAFTFNQFGGDGLRELLALIDTDRESLE